MTEERKTLKKKIDTLYVSSFFNRKSPHDLINQINNLCKTHAKYSNLKFTINYSSQIEVHGTRLENDEEYSKRINASELKKKREEERILKAAAKKEAAEKKKKEERRKLYDKLKAEFESEVS